MDDHAHISYCYIKSDKTTRSMSQSGPRTAFGSFTITVDKIGSDKSSQMTLQHIVKSTAAEKTPDAILVTDLDIIKFIIFLEFYIIRLIPRLNC